MTLLSQTIGEAMKWSPGDFIAGEKNTHKSPAKTGNYDYFCQVLNTFCVSGKYYNSCASEASLLTVFAAKIRLK